MRKLTPILMLALLLIGCTSIGKMLNEDVNAVKEAFVKENPNVRVIPIDLDGDKLPDALGVDADLDGKVDMKDGEPNLVSGSQEAYLEQDATDEGIGDLMTSIGLFGVPALTGLGIWWKKNKWVKRFTASVDAIEQIKTANDGKGGLTRAQINEILRQVVGGISGTPAVVAEVKAILKAKTSV